MSGRVIYPRECQEDSCQERPLARGLCRSHYYQAQRRGALPPRIRQGYRDERLCSVEGCEIIVSALGRCRSHYERARNVGETGLSCRVPGCERGVAGLGMCGRHSALSRRYGLSPVDLAVVDAVPVCQVCGSDRLLRVDHDHETGAVRGVLCHSCNIALGMVEDSTARLRALAGYLERYNAAKPDQDKSRKSNGVHGPDPSI